MKLQDLREKEVVNVADGRRCGCVGDVVIDRATGQITALVIPGRLRLLGLLGREEDLVIPWEGVRRFGEDVILVEGIQAQKKPPKVM